MGGTIITTRKHARNRTPDLLILLQSRPKLWNEAL